MSPFILARLQSALAHLPSGVSLIISTLVTCITTPSPPPPVIPIIKRLSYGLSWSSEALERDPLGVRGSSSGPLFGLEILGMLRNPLISTHSDCPFPEALKGARIMGRVSLRPTRFLFITRLQLNVGKVWFGSGLFISEFSSLMSRLTLYLLNAFRLSYSFREVSNSKKFRWTSYLETSEG